MPPQTDEGFYRDDEGYLHDIVKWHTRQKHKFIEEYLRVWTNYVKKHQPTLDIFDLYASTGLCYCADSEESGGSEPTWEGTAGLAARYLSSYPKGRHLFLNTYNEDRKKCSKQAENLAKIATKCGRTPPYTSITTLPIEEAFEAAIDYGERNGIFNYPNIWILDPYRSTDLPWSIVERIGNLKRSYPSNGAMKVRKPEMIINLMTNDLQRNIDINPRILDVALGMSESEWRPKIDSYLSNGHDTRRAIINVYAERLSVLYEKPPVVTEIKITNDTAIVYCLLLCTDSPAGYYVYNLKGLPEFNNWRISTWKPDAEKITIEKKLPKAQKKLDKFF